MVHGYNGGYVGNVPANSRVNIPPINLEDGKYKNLFYHINEWMNNT